MKKFISFFMTLALIMLCGCNNTRDNSDTRFLFNTVVTLTADCDDEVLSGAFSLCEKYENKLSRTVKSSDVYRINEEKSPVSVSDDTLKIIRKSLYYSDLSTGKFDITVCSVSELWDFNKEVIPSKDEISEALQNVDYHSIKIDGNNIDVSGKKIDLGGIAKGYIADKILEYFENKNVEKGIINLGGNIVVFGDKDYNIGIKKPFSENETAVTVTLRNKSIVTSGIYERYIKKGDTIYHHILDPKTGYAVKTDLSSATVISDSSLDGDALATVCVLEGKDKAKEIIEKAKDTEAVFIDTDGNISYTSGLIRDGNILSIK